MEVNKFIVLIYLEDEKDWFSPIHQEVINSKKRCYPDASIILIHNLSDSRLYNYLREGKRFKNVDGFVSDEQIVREFNPSLYNKIPYLAHKADYLRICALYKYGGMYSDLDSLSVNPVPEAYWNDQFLSCMEYTGQHAICNGWFMSKKGNPMMLDWLKEFESYDQKLCKPGTPDWTRYSVQALWRLHEKYNFTLIPYNLIEPYGLAYSDVENLYFLNDIRHITAIQPYEIHLWETRNHNIMKVLSDRYFNESSATLAQIIRKWKMGY